jgi:hypothetical protein
MDCKESKRRVKKSSQGSAVLTRALAVAAPLQIPATDEGGEVRKKGRAFGWSCFAAKARGLMPEGCRAAVGAGGDGALG